MQTISRNMSITITAKQIIGCLICKVLRFNRFVVIASLVLVSSIPSKVTCGLQQAHHEMPFIKTAVYPEEAKEREIFNITYPPDKGFQCQCWQYERHPEIVNQCSCKGPKAPSLCCPKLMSLTISECRVESFARDNFNFNVTDMEDLTLVDFPELTGFEDEFFGVFGKLRTLEISHAPKLQHVRSGWFKNISSSSFKTLRITFSGLLDFPDLSNIPPNIILHMVDLDGNKISRLETGSVLLKTEQLILDSNELSYIDAEAFKGSQIAKLSIKYNPHLKVLHPLAFTGILSLQTLDLSGTSLEKLPTDGLSELEVLRIQGTQTLKQIPSLYFFKNLRFAYLTHSFHCCAFKFPKRHDPELYRNMVERIELQQRSCIPTGVNKAQDVAVSGSKKSRSLSNENYIVYDDEDFGEFVDDALTFSPNMTIDARCGNITIESFYRQDQVKCFPEPDALNPCEDVMGFVWLRRCVWVVVGMAVFGNVAVLVVLGSFLSDITVPKFLICNNAFADLCMGIYLLLLASIDLETKGEFFNFAYDWQYGAGCQAAGFLTVFASHLSVFTLTVITLERWFAITHAIYLNRRIKLRAATYIMVCGWIYAIVMASLPLFGVSNYSSTSICLPMEALDSISKVYLVVVLALNGLAFIVILVCYANIYFSLGKETRNVGRRGPKGEMTIAKKMALLVFTNFICWSPIAFFGLTALAGHPLIDVTKSKIILVFFYPINSCANPYLYAILTSQYRRDLFLLLSKFGFCKNRAQKYKLAYSLPTHAIQLNMIEMNSLKKKSSDTLDCQDGLQHRHLTTGSDTSMLRKSSKEEFI